MVLFIKIEPVYGDKIKNKMKILEFRKLNLDDNYNDYFNNGFACSRIYEYPLVINLI
jgi:hypothetical protein